MRNGRKERQILGWFPTPRAGLYERPRSLIAPTNPKRSPNAEQPPTQEGPRAVRWQAKKSHPKYCASTGG